MPPLPPRHSCISVLLRSTPSAHSPCSFAPVLLVLNFLLISLFSASSIHAETVRLPVTIDYELLRTMIVERAFTGPNESALVVNEAGGCISLLLSRPQVTEERGVLRLTMDLFVKGGTPFGDRCVVPVEWQGILVLYQYPKLSLEGWKLSFSLVDAELRDSSGRPVKIANLLWQLVQDRALSYVDDIVIDLVPPVTELKAFLLPLFPEEMKQTTAKMLDSIRPGTLEVNRDNLRLLALADVESVYEPGVEELETPLDGEALRKAIELWENWDGILMYLVSILSRQVLTPDEQDILRNLLLDTRYRFLQAQSESEITRDFVREQFVYGWSQLGPIFKRHLLAGAKGSRALGYLAFVSAADSLIVFDRLGPTFGLEISRNGLVRLARMLHNDPSMLLYPSYVSPDLQKLFQVTPEPQEQKSTPERTPEKPKESSSSQGIIPKAVKLVLNLLAPGECYAALPSFKEVLSWKVPPKDLESYIKRVEEVLANASHSPGIIRDVPQQRQEMFHRLIRAMAWQESCFRQFVVRGDKLTYLLSYNNTSVGLMQVNERIWRGIFNREYLRWDINYNADAGCKITAMYMQKYALKDKTLSAKLDDATLARLVYAMYNGGPSQYKKFFERLNNGKTYQSDNLFWEKYQWLISGEVNRIGQCLTGG